jgi:hypothetical protein
MLIATWPKGVVVHSDGFAGTHMPREADSSSQRRLHCVQVTELAAGVVSEIRHIIDPGGHLFGNRVAVQSAALEAPPPPPGALAGAPPPKKRPVRRLANVAGVVPLRPAALVLDSRTQMLWDATEARHVLHCDRYPYFPRVAQGGPGLALLAAQRDESAATGVLVCAAEALEHVHRAAFEGFAAAGAGPPNGAAAPPWDAAAAMAAQRAGVLDGVTLLLSTCTLALKVRKKLVHNVLLDDC